MSFSEALAQIDPERTALITDQGAWRYGALCAQAEALRGAFRPALQGASLALIGGDLAEALLLIAAADGLAQRITLISPAVPQADLSALLEAAGTGRVLTADPALAEDLRRGGLQAGLTAEAVLAGADRASPDETASAEARETAWVMTTSGTTGVPKLVRHRLTGLTRTARLDPARGAGQVWGLLYDYTRFAGLQVVLQALLSGSCLVVPSADQGLSAQIDRLVEAGVTHLSATPTLWRKILMTPAAGQLALQQITLGGEIVDDAVLSILARRWPGARISHVYASTEAGVGFSVTDRRAGFPLSYLSAPPQGIGLRILDERLHVSNPLVADEYLGGRGSFGAGGWVDTGDAVRIEGDRVLFRGRASGVINVGGNKVHPEEVERVLLAHDQVAAARVYARRSPITGELVMADIVLSEGEPDAATKAALLAWAQARLPRHAVPAMLKFTAMFETTAAGKIKRG